MNRLHLGLVSLIVVSACGGSVVVEGTGGTGAGTTGTGAGTTGTGASGTGGSTTSGPCPASQPTGSTSCAGVPDQFRCTYGDSVRPDCRIPWICNDGSWETTGGVCVEPSDCGSSEPPLQTVCTNIDDVCTYGDSICYCGWGGGPICVSPIYWQCGGPPTTPGCPAVVPNDGTPCTAAGVQCSYGIACTPPNAIVNCTNGFWKWNTMIACGG